VTINSNTLTDEAMDSIYPMHAGQWQITYWAISIAKPTRCTISQIYFTLEQHSTCFGLSVYHQESKTVHTTSGICHTGSVAAC